MNRNRGPRLEQWFFGSLYLELLGQGVNEVVRQLTRADVALYSLKLADARGTVGVSLPDFGTVYQICRQNHVKIRFIHKEGLPFVWRAMRRRKSMLVGLLLFAAILYVCQAMVWNINVSGVDAQDAAAIRYVARQAGIAPFVFKQSLPTVDKMQSTLQDRLPSMMWVGVNLVGSEVRIEALKKVNGVEVSPDNPHNIVAARPAVIRRVYATRGSVVVKPGQTVQPGALLINGALGDGTKEVPATGVVLAEVWYRSNVVVQLHVESNTLTGNTVNFDVLQVGGVGLRVWGWRNPEYPAYVDQEKDTTWQVGKFQVPVVWRRVTRFESSRQEMIQSNQQATQTALQIARQDVLSKPGQDRTILGQTVLHKEVLRGKLYATILTRSEEDIGAPAPIPKQATEPEQSQQPS